MSIKQKIHILVFRQQGAIDLHFKAILQKCDVEKKCLPIVYMTTMSHKDTGYT